MQIIMKKIIVILIISLVTGLATHSQGYNLVVYGNVWLENNNAVSPLPGHPVKVIINDSVNGGLFTYQNTVYTDVSGYYEDIVLVPPTIGYLLVEVMTYDSCAGDYQYNSAFWAMGTVLPSLDFYLCGGIGPGGCENYFFYYFNDTTTVTFEGYLFNGQQALSYEWDFGDGTYGSGQTVTHYYQPNPNGFSVYMVSLTTVWVDSSGTACTSVSWQEVWLGGQQDCFASFFYYPDSLDAKTIHFLDMSFINNGGMPTSWYWEFGDGTTSAAQNPVHTYADTGYYFVCLTIADSMGNCTDTYCEEIFTGNPPPPGGCESFILPYSINGLTAEFQGWTYSQFPTEYYWEFGDGVTATGQFVSHTYPTEGIYKVYLQTIDSTGCEFLTWMEVWIGNTWPECSNSFYYEQSDSTTFIFTGQAWFNNGTTTDDVTYSWDFGDGTTGTGQTLTHFFQPNPVNDFYTVCLQTMMMLPDGDSCFAFSCQDVYLVQPTFGIYGFVHLGNNTGADEAIVRLMAMDTLWQTVTEVDAVTVDSGGFYGFGNVPMYNTRLYFVQAELTEGSAHYGDYLPTYHLDALSWENAFPVFPLNNWSADIFMIPATTLNTGNGQITGTVSNLGTRDALEGVLVILMDEDANPLVYSHSAADGTFIFDNLPLGTYILHAEIMGIHTNQAVVSLTEQQTGVSVEIQVTGTEANMYFGIGQPVTSLEKAGEVYPNPVIANAMIDITLREKTEVRLSLYSHAGANLSERTLNLTAGTHQLRLNTEGLPPGLYILSMVTTDGGTISKKVVKL